jgi:hypothetical protein
MLRAAVATLFVAVCCAFAAVASAEDLEYKRVKLVANPTPRSFFFRTNEPMSGPSFAYQQLLQYFGQRVAEANISTWTASKKVYMVDIALNTIFEHGVLQEQAYFEKNPKMGKFENWVLVGDVIAPQMLTPAEQQAMISNGTVWKLDKIPERIVSLHNMLLNGPPPGYDILAVFAHCSAGEDRTGEFVLSYELSYGSIYQKYYPSFADLYRMDCSWNQTGAGRCPASFSTWAASWYCLTYNMFNATAATQRSDCLKGYDCKLWSSCQPAN